MSEVATMPPSHVIEEMPVKVTKAKKKPSLKTLVLAELLDVCMETTDNERKKREQEKKETKEQKPKFTDAQFEEAAGYLKKLGWNTGNAHHFIAAFSVFLDAPELNKVGRKKELPKFPLFCVVVIEENKGGHSYALHKPHIVAHSLQNTCLHTDGRVGASYFNAEGLDDKVRVATKEEVKQCIKNLTDAQVRTIMTIDQFGPIVNAAIEVPIED